MLPCPGGPKWLLGASDVAAGSTDNGTQYGAGFGYLRALPSVGTSNSSSGPAPGPVLLSTYYRKDNNSGHRTREFGVGFARNNISASGWQVAHTVAVPPGADPVAVLEIQITNTANHSQSGVWQEVIGARMVLMDYFATLALSHLDPFYKRLADRHEFSATHYRTPSCLCFTSLKSCAACPCYQGLACFSTIAPTCHSTTQCCL